MHDHAQSVTVLIQSCAVLINLCAGDSFERRDHAAMAGALPAIADAMRKHIGSPILQEMSFVALQNICFGNDSNGADRKAKAVEIGVLKDIVQAMTKHSDVDSLVEQGSSTLRLLVGKDKSAKQKALDAGANPKWLKTGGFLSRRLSKSG
uniref:Armadillo repeat-containing protein 8 n=1 Tax=Haptolina ericina TaxID=156174 RepID=A0A7S3AJR7_9EUKA|mmetsp:Transcript_1901/g.4258  ORF Transcript_1901/g.4258 Transcript_1901/m.4258 type:complete len:150 (+) Transcript_1901:192-641(+)